MTSVKPLSAVKISIEGCILLRDKIFSRGVTFIMQGTADDLFDLSVVYVYAGPEFHGSITSAIS